MLSPDARTLAVEFLRPPPGFQLDWAVVTTYTLDLEALLGLPLGVLSHADADLETLLADPLLLIEALREAGGRLHVFVDESGIAVPRSSRELYALLEDSVHPVRARGGGVFHPKVWIARFVRHGEEVPRLRAGVMSRNLTFDRSWDVAVASEAEPARAQRAKPTQPLADLLRTLPGLSTQGLPDAVAKSLIELSEEVGRTRFPAPEGFDDPISYHVIGLDGLRRRRWLPKAGARVLAVAPFVSQSALDALAQIGTNKRLLISRSEELDGIPDPTLASWRLNLGEEVLTLREGDLGEAEDGGNPRLSGLHAKIIAVERGWEVDWHVGSANLTNAALTGANVEAMATISGARGRPSSDRGNGIEQFLNAGFRKLCTPYERADGESPAVKDDGLADARKRLDEAQAALLAAPLYVVCNRTDGGISCVVKGNIELPDGVDAVTWPVSMAEERALPIQPQPEWLLPIPRVTAFMAFRLHVPHEDAIDVRMTRKLHVEGMPEGRLNEVLRIVIDNPERFLQLLRALLGGLDGMVDWARGEPGDDRAPWAAGFGADSLLEDLMRAASREPGRLEPVRRLIEQLADSAEGPQVIPRDFLDVWKAVDDAMAKSE